jgi:hypothetical protein
MDHNLCIYGHRKLNVFVAWEIIFCNEVLNIFPCMSLLLRNCINRIIFAQCVERSSAPLIFLLILQVETVDDYDEYCHYVAGLVGLGLSKLFHAADLEDLASDELSNSMGLFLQVY